jgi:hypothetical protein
MSRPREIRPARAFFGNEARTAERPSASDFCTRALCGQDKAFAIVPGRLTVSELLEPHAPT